MNQNELNLGPADPIEAADLEREPSQQGKTYEEMRRQAKGAFNLCYVFAGFGILQGLVGLFGIVFYHLDPKMAGGLLTGGGFFGYLSGWALKLSRASNRQLERITNHQKAWETIDSMIDSNKKYEETSKYLKALLTQPKD
jgi:hypothetical protein